MKRKTGIFIGIVVVFLICMIVYFRPMPLPGAASEDAQISMTLTVYEIRNGEPQLDSVEYKDLTAEQKSAVFALLEEFRYRRTFGTLFSDGDMTGVGNKTLSIFVVDGDSPVDRIFVGSSGKIAVNDKNYSIKNAQQLIAKIIEIMEN